MNFVSLILLLLISLPGMCQEVKPPFNANSELKKAGYKQLHVTALLDPKVVTILIRALNESRTHEIPAAQIRQLIMSNVKGKPSEKMLLKFPKILDIMVDFMKDRKAMPDLLSILLRKKDLEIFLMIIIAILVLGLLFEKYLVPKSWSKFEKFLADTFLGICTTWIGIFIFYHMFEKELAPSLGILKYHL